MALHLASEIEKLIASDFTINGKAMPERAIGQRLGITQSQLNGLRKGTGAGWHAVLALSRYTHQSIDVLLGRELPLPVTQRQEQLDRMIELSDQLMTSIGEHFSFGPSSKTGKIWAEIQRLRALAIGQKHLDEQRIAHAKGRKSA
jgi:hypothetical protein